MENSQEVTLNVVRSIFCGIREQIIKSMKESKPIAYIGNPEHDKQLLQWCKCVEALNRNLFQENEAELFNEFLKECGYL